MSDMNDLFDREVNGYRNRPGSYSNLPTSRIIKSRRKNSFESPTLSIIDPAVDEIWGGYVGTAAPHSYFDYYFSGQDIRVYIDGTLDDPNYSSIPIMEMGLSIEQKKEPIYGFWDYTYSAVMRGTRIITGQMTIATKSPDYMKNLLSKAAETRSRNAQGVAYKNYRQLTEDDNNIERYWGKNLDPAIASQGKTIFSVHPPFTMIVLYGLQNISLNPTTYTVDQYEAWAKYQEDTALATDTNERLVDSDPEYQVNRMVIEAVELVQMSTGFSSSGAVVAETYSFFARDMVVPTKTSYSYNEYPRII